MRAVAFHRNAASYLKRMPADRKAQVLAAMETLKPHSNPGDHQNVKAMQGEWAGIWRFRVGSLRVVFRIAKLPDPIQPGQPDEVIDILLIGPRGDIYQ